MRLNPKKNITSWGRIAGPGLPDWLSGFQRVWLTPFEIFARVKVPYSELLLRRFKISKIVYAIWVSPDGRLKVKLERIRSKS